MLKICYKAAVDLCIYLYVIVKYNHQLSFFDKITVGDYRQLIVRQAKGYWNASRDLKTGYLLKNRQEGRTVKSFSYVSILQFYAIIRPFQIRHF